MCYTRSFVSYFFLGSLRISIFTLLEEIEDERGYPEIQNLFPLAPENCDLNNFVWVFLLILSGVFRLSTKYGLSRFLLSLCCHADKNIISNLMRKFKLFIKLTAKILHHAVNITLSIRFKFSRFQTHSDCIGLTGYNIGTA